MKKLMILPILIGTILTCGGETIPLTDSNAIRCIVGESGNQPYRGMVGVANVIRTRKNLNGFYGFHNPIVNKQPKWVWEQATKAWHESKTNNIVGGATHFESIHFKKPYWAYSMKETIRIKDHIFYK